MSDLVDKLRDAWESGDADEVLLEAIDEIERLRAVLAKVRERVPSRGETSLPGMDLFVQGWNMFRTEMLERLDALEQENRDE